MSPNNNLNSINGFDGHCHVFNGKYLLKEIANIIYDKFRGNYLNHSFMNIRNLRSSTTDSEFRNKIKAILELASAILNSNNDNIEFIQTELKKKWNINAGIVPLMMDIYFILWEPITESTKFIQQKKGILNLYIPSSPDDAKAEFKSILEEFIDENKQTDSEKFIEFGENIEAHIEEAFELHSSTIPVLNSIFGTKSRYDYIDMSWGYKNDFNKLINAKANNMNIFPFLSVDPRRKGILKAIKDESLVGENGIFSGIKLYPRLGYHPGSKPMMDIFDICAERDLPIYTHCGLSGFPSFYSNLGSGNNKRWAYNDYGNPDHFIPALEKHNKLRINFAHMGSIETDPKLEDDLRNGSEEWAKKVLDLVVKYDNVYTDLSCYTEIDNLRKAKKFIDTVTNYSVIDKVIYGSDFDVMYFTNMSVPMEKYCDNFDVVFGDDVKKMRYDNVIKFLKLKNKGFIN